MTATASLVPVSRSGDAVAAIDVAHSPVVWSGAALDRAVAIDPAAAIARLPLTDNHDPFERLAAAFLVGYPPNSAKAYRSDLAAWWRFCTAAGVHPFDALRHHVDAWVRSMETQSSSTSSVLAGAGESARAKPLKPASIRRRLAAVSKFYRYAIEAGVLSYSPVDQVRRPRAAAEPQSTGLTREELGQVLDAAVEHSPRYGALVALLAFNGLRIDEAIRADVGDYRHREGHRVLHIVRKGGRSAVVPLAPPVVRALDDYLDGRSSGPLFLNRDGTTRLPYSTAFEQIRRLARSAGIASADQITPHSFRHAFITHARAAGAPLQDVQAAAGHKDPATTQLYDHTRLRLDQHPTYLLATYLRA